MPRRLLLVLVATLFAAGCLASTDIETMTRPDWTPTAFERMVVYYSSSNLDARKQVEDRFAARDSAFVPGYKLFFPGKTYQPEEVSEIMEENDLDAALVIVPKGAGTSETTVPGQTTTRCTLTVGNTCQQATTTGGPMTVTKPNAAFGAVVLEWESQQNVWAASAESGGNAFADQGNLRKSFVDAVIEKLRADGLLR